MCGVVACTCLFMTMYSINETLLLLYIHYAGLVFLHQPNVEDGLAKPVITHGDMKSSNILVKDNGESVLSDFGLSLKFSSATDEEVWYLGVQLDTAAIKSITYV